MSNKETIWIQNILMSLLINVEAIPKQTFFNLFYLAHLYYTKETGKVLSDEPIVRGPKGPEIQDYKELVASLPITHREVSVLGPITALHVFLAKGTKVDPIEDDEVKRAITRTRLLLLNSPSEQINALVREYSRSWQDTANGEVMLIARDLISEELANRIETTLSTITDEELENFLLEV